MAAGGRRYLQGPPTRYHRIIISLIILPTKYHHIIINRSSYQHRGSSDHPIIQLSSSTFHNLIGFSFPSQDGRASAFLSWEEFADPAIYKIHFATRNYFRFCHHLGKLIQYFVAREQQQDTFYPFVEVVFEVNPYDTIAATIIIIIIIIITPLFPIEIFVCFYFLGEGSLSALPCTSSP